MAAKRIPSSWEELPEDLLGQLLKCLTSLGDRVRLRAVCRPWRSGAAARRHPLVPPPSPWLALQDGTLVDLHGAPVRCGAILRQGVDFCYLAVDNLAFLVRHDDQCSLMNPLSGLNLPLPKLGPAVRRDSSGQFKVWMRNGHVKVKILPSIEDPTHPLVATIIAQNSVAMAPCKDHDAISISLYEDWRGNINFHKSISDIAFFHGDLYALTNDEGLHILKLDCGLSKPKFSQAFHPCIAGDPKQKEYMVQRYLAESDGRLLMVRRWTSGPLMPDLGDHEKTSRFDVFEANLATIPSPWMKVKTLGGQALFLGLQCSKSVLGSQFAGGVREDCIYFMDRMFDYMDPLGDSGMYNMRNGEITPFLPEAVMAELQGKRQLLTWFFPADE